MSPSSAIKKDLSGGAVSDSIGNSSQSLKIVFGSKDDNLIVGEDDFDFISGALLEKMF